MSSSKPIGVRRLRPAAPADNPSSLALAKVVEITDEGRVLIEGPDPGSEVVEAIWLERVPDASQDWLVAGAEVVVDYFVQGCSRPVILGCIRTEVEPRLRKLGQKDLKEIVVDCDRLVLTAAKEITLRCGDASISLKENGKLVVRGTEVVSRASRANKIKGSTVSLN